MLRPLITATALLMTSGPAALAQDAVDMRPDSVLVDIYGEISGIDGNIISYKPAGLPQEARFMQWGLELSDDPALVEFLLGRSVECVFVVNGEIPIADCYASVYTSHNILEFNQQLDGVFDLFVVLPAIGLATRRCGPEHEAFQLANADFSRIDTPSRTYFCDSGRLGRIPTAHPFPHVLTQPLD